VIDVANPAAPADLGLFPTNTGGSPSHMVQAVAAADACVYVSDNGNVAALDVSNPAAPHASGAFPDVQHDVVDLEVSDGLVYAASLTQGVQLIDFGPGCGFAPPRIDLDLGSPVSTVPPGGTVPVQVSLHNTAAAGQTFSFTLKLTLPTGVVLLLVNGATLTFPPGFGITPTIQLALPTAAPRGVYTLAGTIQQAGITTDAASLTYTILQ